MLSFPAPIEVWCGGGVANVDDGQVKPVTFSAFNLSDFNHQEWDCTGVQKWRKRPNKKIKIECILQSKDFDKDCFLNLILSSYTNYSLLRITRLES